MEFVGDLPFSRKITKAYRRIASEFHNRLKYRYRRGLGGGKGVECILISACISLGIKRSIGMRFFFFFYRLTWPCDMHCT